MNYKNIYHLLLSAILFFLTLFIIRLSTLLILPLNQEFKTEKFMYKLSIRENLNTPPSKEAIKSVVNSILKLKENGVTILMINQDIPGVGYFSDKYTQMDLEKKIKSEKYYAITEDIDCFSDYFISSPVNLESNLNNLISDYDSKGEFFFTLSNESTMKYSRLLSPHFLLYLEMYIFVIFTYFFIINSKIWGLQTIVTAHIMSGADLINLNRRLIQKITPYIVLGFLFGYFLFSILLSKIFLSSIPKTIIAAIITSLVIVFSSFIAVTKEYNKISLRGHRYD